MTKFSVAITSEAEGPTVKSTPDMDAALDWFTNACTEVVDPEADLSFASLTVDGVVWGVIKEGGVAQDDGEVVDLKARRVA